MNALLRILAWLLAVALVALPVVAVLNGWVGAGHWPLSRLRVQGELVRVDPAQLQATVLPSTKVETRPRIPSRVRREPGMRSKFPRRTHERSPVGRTNT